MDFDETRCEWSAHGSLQSLLFCKIQSGTEIGQGDPHLLRTSSSDRKANSTSRMHNIDLEACGIFLIFGGGSIFLT